MLQSLVSPSLYNLHSHLLIIGKDARLLFFPPNVYVPFMFRMKGHIPDAGKRKPEDTFSTHVKTSLLPTLPEEETSDLKATNPGPMVREEADGKDETTEVNTHNKQTHTQN